MLNKAICQNFSQLKRLDTGDKEDLIRHLTFSTAKQKRFSFTVLFGAFHLNSGDLVEYLTHSLSLVFLFAPLIQKANSGPQ